MTTETHYPDFQFKPEQLARYIEAAGTFSLLFKDGNIVHFTAPDPAEFRKWLDEQGVVNIRNC